MTESAKTPVFSLQQLAQKVQAECVGDADLILAGVNTLQNGATGEIGFLSNPKYRNQLASTALSAVVVSPKDTAALAENGLSGLAHPDPYAAFATITMVFEQTPAAAESISDQSLLHADAKGGHK